MYLQRTACQRFGWVTSDSSFKRRVHLQTHGPRHWLSLAHNTCLFSLTMIPIRKWIVSGRPSVPYSTYVGLSFGQHSTVAVTRHWCQLVWPWSWRVSTVCLEICVTWCSTRSSCNSRQSSRTLSGPRYRLLTSKSAAWTTSVTLETRVCKTPCAQTVFRSSWATMWCAHEGSTPHGCGSNKQHTAATERTNWSKMHDDERTRWKRPSVTIGDCPCKNWWCFVGFGEVSTVHESRACSLGDLMKSSWTECLLDLTEVSSPCHREEVENAQCPQARLMSPWEHQLQYLDDWLPKLANHVTPQLSSPVTPSVFLGDHGCGVFHKNHTTRFFFGD